MSSWLGQTNGAQLGIGPNVATDDRAVAIPLNYQWAHQPCDRSRESWDDGQLWTLSRGVGGQMSGYGLQTDDANTYGGRWEPYDQANGWDAAGGQKQNVIVGATQDANGNPVGSCVVEGFVVGASNATGSSTSVGKVTSDASGYYRLPTPNLTTTNHFVVVFKFGPPDIAGVSDNTLTPTSTG